MPLASDSWCGRRWRVVVKAVAQQQVGQDELNNTIQIPDNTKIINSKWVQDATILTLSNNSKITIQHADEYDYELGANVMTGDNGTSMTFIELASVFDINIPSNGIAENTDDFYII